MPYKKINVANYEFGMQTSLPYDKIIWLKFRYTLRTTHNSLFCNGNRLKYRL